MKLLLIRHPRPDVDEGLCYGRMDVPPQAAHLDETVEALRARWQAAGNPPHRVFSSPLRRCALVANALADRPWPRPVFDPRIAEMSFGHWEGRPWAEVPAEQMSAWRADIGRVAPPGGESLADVSRRLLDFVDEHLAAPEHDETEVVVVTHVGIIQTALRVLRGEPMNGFGKIRIDFGSVTTLVRRDGRFEIESLSEAP
ncbi:MAG: hypothetical protein RIS35_2117 [Pseudomonadota bacterium]|jgi:alpha-ribazole phosphatase